MGRRSCRLTWYCVSTVVYYSSGCVQVRITHNSIHRCVVSHMCTGVQHVRSAQVRVRIAHVPFALRATAPFLCDSGLCCCAAQTILASYSKLSLAANSHVAANKKQHQGQHIKADMYSTCRLHLGVHAHTAATARRPYADRVALMHHHVTSVCLSVSQ